MALLVLKVGGSLFSDKRQSRTADLDALDRYAAAIAELCRLAPGRIVLVSGGGAYGHDAVRSLDPDDPHAALPLTEAMFSLKWLWTSALRAHDCSAVPLQLTGLCRSSTDEVSVELQAIRQMLDREILPVLSGDVYVRADGSLGVFGSDRVPGALLSLGDGGGTVRVATLTDVPGVLLGGPSGNEVLREIDPDDPAAATAAIWATPAWDTSDSMAGKLAAMVSIACRGAECLILEGQPDIKRLKLLLDPVDTWPASLDYTRISTHRERVESDTKVEGTSPHTSPKR